MENVLFSKVLTLADSLFVVLSVRNHELALTIFINYFFHPCVPQQARTEWSGFMLGPYNG